MAVSRQKGDSDSLNYRRILIVATGKPLNYLRARISGMLNTKSEKSLKCSVVEKMEGNTQKPSQMGQSASQVTSNRGEKWRHRPKRQMWIPNESLWVPRKARETDLCYGETLQGQGQRRYCTLPVTKTNCFQRSHNMTGCQSYGGARTWRCHFQEDEGKKVSSMLIMVEMPFWNENIFRRKQKSSFEEYFFFEEYLF